MLRSLAVSPGRGSRISRIGIAAALLTATALVFSGSAAGQEPLSDLEARMETIQGRFDANTEIVEKLRARTKQLDREIEQIEARTIHLRRQRTTLIEDAIRQPSDLYGSDATGSPVALVRSENLGDLAERQEILSRVSMKDATLLVKLAKAETELEILDEVLEAREVELEREAERLAEASKELQKHFRSIATEYQRLRRRVSEPERPGGSNASATDRGGMPCPVDGPVSFVDSWGDLRSGGRAHAGTDMMADYGTPVVAIVSGTVSFAEYDGSGGYMIMFDGDDGNQYWYVHNQENLVVVGQKVEAGEQIATVGDTGNAAGTPHVHFEFHPGGGAAVNPYSLVSSLC